MINTEKPTRIAFIGGGPSALYLCRNLTDAGKNNIEITIFEKSDTPGQGMPYSSAGANKEHVANISASEIPPIINTFQEWIFNAPAEVLQRFGIQLSCFNEYEVLQRLLIGEYLSAQFHAVLAIAEKKGIKINVRTNHTVLDIQDIKNEVVIQTDKNAPQSFDHCIICTGHSWPKTNEGKISGYYDSPYPPAKLHFQVNHAVAIRGSSLTAIDAIRTLSRIHGNFHENSKGMLSYHLNEENKNFRMVLHSSGGMLPVIRTYLKAPQSESSPLTPELIAENKAKNNGFLSLDFVFDIAFKNLLHDNDPDFYKRIQDMNMEAFVEAMMELRERIDPFILFEAEYREAEKSIQRHEPVYWKSMLALLSFTMNYPAKYFAAEDMIRLQNCLSELISIVIASVPQSSARELLALHTAGVLDIIEVDKDSRVAAEKEAGIMYHYKNVHGIPISIFYKTFIDAIGQKSFSLEEFPFKTLVDEKTVAQAWLQFNDIKEAEKELANGNKDIDKKPDGSYCYQVPGIAINDSFQVLDENYVPNDRIYIMAVPYIHGYNPDYSGLDFCNKTSQLICQHLMNQYDTTL